jgi:hypothetical protein
MNEALRDWLRTHTPVQTKPNPNKKPKPITPVGIFAGGQAGLAFVPLSIHGLLKFIQHQQITRIHLR